MADTSKRVCSCDSRTNAYSLNYPCPVHMPGNPNQEQNPQARGLHNCCNCDQAISLAHQLEITATALQGIKDALGLPSTPEMRLDAIGTLIGLAESNLERLNRG